MADNYQVQLPFQQSEKGKYGTIFSRRRTQQDSEQHHQQALAV